MKKSIIPKISTIIRNTIPKQPQCAKLSTENNAKATTQTSVSINKTLKNRNHSALEDIKPYTPPKLKWQSFSSGTSATTLLSQAQKSNNSNGNSDRAGAEDDDFPSILYSAVTFFLLLYAVEEFFSITTCIGPSMLPTFREDGDVVIVQNLDHSKTILGRLFFNSTDDSKCLDKPPRWYRNVYQKGDAVICCCKDDKEKTVCKRVAGLEGDVVSYRGNGITSRMVRVPRGHVWLLGDNPNNSKDSRSYGPVPIGLIQGKILCKIYLPQGLYMANQKVIEWVDHVFPLPKKEEDKDGEDGDVKVHKEVDAMKESKNRQEWLKERKERFSPSLNSKSDEESNNDMTGSSVSSDRTTGEAATAGSTVEAGSDAGGAAKRLLPSKPSPFQLTIPSPPVPTKAVSLEKNRRNQHDP